MKQLLSFLGRSIGFHFAPDNHVVPVLRLERYHRVEGPGFFWIRPLLERTLPPVKTSLYVGNFFFEEVLSQNNIPFNIQMTVLFTFNPHRARKEAAAMLTRGDEALLQLIVRDYANQGVRRLVSRFEAERLSRDTILASIERDLTRQLKAELHNLGIAPLPTGGVLIKETRSPESFRQTMLDVNHDQSLLKVIGTPPFSELIPYLYPLIFANSLKERSGELVVMGAPEHVDPLAMTKRESLYQSNGRGNR